MAFKLMEKRAGIKARNPKEVSVFKNGFSIGNDLVNHWGEHTCAEIYFDTEFNKVGFRPSSNIITGFKFNKKGKSWTLSAALASKRIPLGCYNARVEEGMIIFDVKEIAAERK